MPLHVHNPAVHLVKLLRKLHLADAGQLVVVGERVAKEVAPLAVFLGLYGVAIAFQKA